MTEKIEHSTLLRLFFFIVIIEIVVGGSGRLIEFGPLSLKMVLFCIAMVVAFFQLTKIKTKLIFKFIGYFLITVSVGFIMAAFNNAELEYLIEDIKPLLFFFMIIYFAINIRNVRDVELTMNLIKWASATMGVIYLIIVLGLFMGFINYGVFYAEQSEGNEVFFRNEYFFFYKGFLYLGIGFFISILSGNKKDKFLAIILFVALCLTLTRGFILSACLIFLYFVFFINKSYFLKIFVTVVVFASIIYLIPLLFSTLGDKSGSDIIRLVTISQVIDSINYFSFLIGHGFGIGVPLRPVHMEISFLEIFHKQGVIGLFFWFSLLVAIIKSYLKIHNKKLKKTALPLVLSVCFVYIQSFTNPFVNNPIGISIIVITIVCMLRINEEDQSFIKAGFT